MATERLEPGYNWTEQGGPKLSRRKFFKLAKKYGIPGRGFRQITKGEAGHQLLVQQHDPGDGMVGYTQFQFTPAAWGEGSAAKNYWNKLGGAQGMRNVENQFKMARFLYKSTGNSFKPWYGTRFLTDRSEEGTLGPVRKGMDVAPPTLEAGNGADRLRSKVIGSYQKTSTDVDAMLLDSLVERQSGKSLFEDVQERLISGAYESTQTKNIRGLVPARAKRGGASPAKGRVRGGTAESLVDELEGWSAKNLGIGGSSRDRNIAGNRSVGGAADSDHLEEPGQFRGREAIDLPTTEAQGGWDQYRKVARWLGVKADPGGMTTGEIKAGGKRFRVQIIFGDAHGHGDHIHVGFRRVK